MFQARRQRAWAVSPVADNEVQEAEDSEPFCGSVIGRAQSPSTVRARCLAIRFNSRGVSAGKLLRVRFIRLAILYVRNCTSNIFRTFAQWRDSDLQPVIVIAADLLAATIWRKSRLVAAIIRTSTEICLLPPTCAVAWAGVRSGFHQAHQETGSIEPASIMRDCSR